MVEANFEHAFRRLDVTSGVDFLQNSANLIKPPPHRTCGCFGC